MAITSPSGRGKYIRYLFSLGDLAIINLVFLALTFCFPGIGSDSSVLRELWLLVNLSCLPVYILVLSVWIMSSVPQFCRWESMRCSSSL